MTLLRAARPDEAAAITELALRSKRSWGYPDVFMARAAEGMVVSEADVECDHVEVLESNDGLMGFFRLRRQESCAWLEDLFIDPSIIGLGQGRRLFERVCEVARGWGCTCLAFQSDPHAETFYEHLGARRVASQESRLFPGRMLPLMRMQL